ncbi:MAG: hypothetical protein M3Z96_15115 [Pseudomonadota bacterium]|nr:hypothetical protein [Pseudomonadota bacterium]
MADGDPLIIGNPNTGTSKTSLTTNVEDPALFVENTGFGSNSAISAKYVGPQAAGSAIVAEGNFSGLTALAKDKDADAIVGFASSTSGTATGVQGVTEGASLFSQEPRVLCGVHGFANTGTGVRGDSISGFGVSAASPQGIALKVEGKSAFATAGNGVIQAGVSHSTVPETHVTSQSHITVTLTGNPGNHANFCPWRRPAAVDWIERIAGVGFVIHLSKKLSNKTPFSYLIVEPI